MSERSDGGARLGVGARGEPVRKTQRALIDLGFDLGKAGADGVSGQATATAVRQFKANGEKFVFHDPDPASSNAFEAGFGFLTFDSANGRLSTAESGTDMVVSADGLHASGDRRYQIISLTSV